MKCPKILSLLLMILLLSTGYASAAPSQTLKIAAGDPEDSEMGVVGNAFKEYIEEKTKGDVEIQCFYSGSLGDESECLRNVQKGTLPMAMAGIANLVPFEKKLGLLTLPYLFANLNEVVAGTNCGIVEQLCHKIRIPYPYVDLYGLPLHLQCQAPHHQDGRHAGPEVPRAPERRADRRL